MEIQGFSRGRKRIVDGTVRSLIPSESRTPRQPLSDPLNLLTISPGFSSSSFHFCSFSSHFSSCYLSHRLVLPALFVHRALRVGIQRPHNRLLVHSVSPPPFFHLFLIQTGWPSFFIHLFLAQIFHRQRYAGAALARAARFPRKRNGSKEGGKEV